MTGRDLEISVDEAMPIEPGRAAQVLLYAIAGLFALTLIWAGTASLDRVTRGIGRVAPSNQLQEVQYLEGGIVEEILVRAGDEVEAGQVLVRLDPTQLSVEFRQGKDSYNMLAARIARLQAEAGRTALSFPPELSAGAPQIAANERALHAARKAELAVAINVETAKLEQRRQSHEDARVALAVARQSLALAKEESEMLAPLVEKGIEPQIELLRARQRETAARGEVQRAEIAVARAELEVREAEGELDRVSKAFSASAVDDLNKAKAELADLIGELPALKDKVARTEVRAPVAGVVNRVLVSTVGGVVQPGQTIVEIVPSEDTLVVEAQIKPADIGFLHVGQAAKVKLTAYDSAVYGSMDGRIETISPDVIQDEDTGERHYLITVRTDKPTLASNKGELQILAGMAAEVDILNGKRTVLSYLMTPLSRVQKNALREQ